MDEKTRYKEQARSDRIKRREEAEEAQASHERARQRHEEREKRQPPVKTIEWLGARMQVLNPPEARKMLRRVKGPDDNIYYRDLVLFPDTLRGEEHAVFLLAKEPLAVETLALTRRLEGHPQLRIDGLICAAGLQARQVLVGDITRTWGQLHDAPEGDAAPVLAAFGPACADLVVLAAGSHAFTAGLDCDALIATDFHASAVLVRGPSRINCLVETGGDVFFPEELPRIDFHVANRDTDMGRVLFCQGGSHRWSTRTHRLEDIVRPEWLIHETAGPVRLMIDRVLALPRAAALLRPAGEIARIYADFPARLTQAMEEFATLLESGVRVSGVVGHGRAEFSLVTETIAGEPMRCRQLLRRIAKTSAVLARALQRLDDGRLWLHITHETSPRRERHVRWAELDEDDAEARTIKRALLDGMNGLRASYGRPAR
jgi:hypothetical protein